MRFFEYLKIIVSLEKVMKNIKVVFFFIFILCLVEGLLTSVSITSIIPITSTLTGSNNIDGYFFKDFLNKFNLEVDQLILLLIVILLFKIMSVIIRKILSVLSAERLRSLLHSYILRSILSKKYSSIMTFPRGELIEKLARNTDSTSMMIFKITNLLSNFVIIIALIITSLLVDFFITTTIMVVFLFAYIFIIKGYLKKINQIGKQKTVKQENLTSLFSSLIFSIKEIYLFNSKNFFLGKTKEKTESLKKTRIKSKLLISLPQDFIEFFLVLLVAIILIFINYENVLKTYLPNLIFFFLIFYRLYQSTINFIKEIANIESIKYAYSNIYNEFIKNYDHENLVSEEKDNDEILKKYIKVSNLYFNFYSKETKKKVDLLKNLNIKIEKEKITQIIGPSGSGKTTLLDLLAKLYSPNKGKIFFDKNNINQLDEKVIRKNIAYVTQNCSLFEGSVAENIILDRNFKKSKLLGIMKICDLRKVNINKLVTDGGKNLSGGEIKRISLARALYQEPQIIFIDETFASIDENSEKKIINELRKKKLTVILISHRKSSKKYVDKIFYVN